MVRVMAVLGAIALFIAAIAGGHAYYSQRLELAQAVGHAEGFIQGLSLGLTLQKDAPKNNRL